MTESALPARPGPDAPAARLGEILRVDHAGELAAVHIYRGQRAVLTKAPGKDRIAYQLQEMEAHEAEHLAAFNQLLTRRRVRPTLLAPIWRVAAFARPSASTCACPCAYPCACPSTRPSASA